ncbi:hypothetical protein ACWCYZ_43745 [Streptomyces virginiae]
MTNYEDPATWEENAQRLRELANKLRDGEWAKRQRGEKPSYSAERDIVRYEEEAKKDAQRARNMRAHQSGVRPPSSAASTASQAARVLREMEEDEHARKQARYHRNDW